MSVRRVSLFEIESCTEKESRVLSMSGVFAINMDFVNLDDVLRARRPGNVVRITGNMPINDVFRYIGFDEPALGCIAGWISDEE